LQNSRAEPERLAADELRPAFDAVSANPATDAPVEEPTAAQAGAEPAIDTPPAAPADVRPPPGYGIPRSFELPRRTGPVAVFVSRKERKVFVRQGFEPLFDAPVAIRDPNVPFGTHVFTAMEFKDDGAALRWTAVSMPGEPDAKPHQPPKGARRIADVLHERSPTRTKASPPPPPPQSAGAVLDRIELPKEAIDRISELMSPGSSLVVSDHGLGYETGRGTDFIVVTR
jgi:hypothetical protein